MILIDGKQIASDIRKNLKNELDQFKADHAATRSPGCAFILIGNNKASHTYVAMKKKGCEEVGIVSFVFTLKEDVSEKELLKLIHDCNINPLIDGILIQQPLPKHLDEEKIISSVAPSKDVDGFHPMNIGKALLGHQDTFFSCTPLGIVTLLDSYKVPIEGKHVVIVGRSNIVGKPLAALLVQKQPQRNATVTIAHSHTRNLKELCKQADILVAAIGSPYFIQEDMVKQGAIVIDVGINTVQKDGNFVLVGDVDFEHVKNKTHAITPVPGGVGPMTIAMLLQNTLLAFLRHQALTE